MFTSFTNRNFLDPKRFRKLLGSDLEESDADLERGKSYRSENYSLVNIDVIKKDGEIEPLGVTWRYFLKLLMWVTMDEVNALLLTRGLQPFLPFASFWH